MQLLPGSRHGLRAAHCPAKHGRPHRGRSGHEPSRRLGLLSRARVRWAPAATLADRVMREWEIGGLEAAASAGG
jgi:hypothetical protein